MSGNQNIQSTHTSNDPHHKTLYQSPLVRYRALSPLAGIRVSPLQLGALSIRDKREQFGMGTMNKESSFRLLDAFLEAGSNFIDTANVYSQELIEEWTEQRGIRNQLVIATKASPNAGTWLSYSANYMRGEDSIKQKVHHTGKCLKSRHLSVEASLKKLRTTYINILHVHWWDFATSTEEVERPSCTRPGISDTPAWIISRANQPGPFNVLAGGKIDTDAEEERRRQTGEKGCMMRSTEWELANEAGTEHITAVSITHVMQKRPYVFPIIGGQKVEHSMSNTEALKISPILE
ncbi:Aldo/keto reductase [Gyrodon lividus]|nr:Aldo/keto reductase [Gyrodon lividus]